MKDDIVKDEELLCESCNNYIIQKWSCYITKLCMLTGKAVSENITEHSYIEPNRVLTCNKWRKKE